MKTKSYVLARLNNLELNFDKLVSLIHSTHHITQDKELNETVSRIKFLIEDISDMIERE